MNNLKLPGRDSPAKVRVGLVFQVWVNQGDNKHNSPSDRVHGGLHSCDKNPFESKEKAFTYIAWYKNMIIGVCSSCTRYVIWIEVDKKNILQSKSVKCEGCKEFCKCVVVDDVKYYFCQKCNCKSGPAIYQYDKNKDDILPISSKAVKCNGCSKFCIRKIMLDIRIYFCETCKTYKGQLSKKEGNKLVGVRFVKQ
jgi:hypothetical protein